MKKYKGFMSNSRFEKEKLNSEKNIKNMFLILIIFNFIMAPMSIERVLNLRNSNKLDEEIIVVKEEDKKKTLVKWIEAREIFNIEGRINDGYANIKLKKEDFLEFRELNLGKIENIRVVEEEIEVIIK